MSDKKLTFIATAAFGLEGIVKRELQHLGFEDAKAELGGVPLHTRLSTWDGLCLHTTSSALTAGTARSGSLRNLFRRVCEANEKGRETEGRACSHIRVQSLFLILPRQ